MSRSLLEQTPSLESTPMLEIAEALNPWGFSCLNDGQNSTTSEDYDPGSLKCWFSSVPRCGWFKQKLLIELVNDNTVFYNEHLIDSLGRNSLASKLCLQTQQRLHEADISWITLTYLKQFQFFVFSLHNFKRKTSLFCVFAIRNLFFMIKKVIFSLSKQHLFMWCYMLNNSESIYNQAMPIIFTMRS